MKELIEQYRENGFCVVRSHLDTRCCDEVLHDVQCIFKEQIEKTSNVSCDGRSSLLEDMKELLALDKESYIAAAKQSAKLWSVQNFINNKANMRFTRELGLEIPTLSTQPVLHISSEQLKVPNGYFGFEAHQDWPSIQGSLDCVITWAPLVEVSIKNFPLTVFSESHKKGLIDGEVLPGVFRINEQLLEGCPAVRIEASPGDVVFMSSWTAHKTTIDDCEGFRLAVSSRWENAAEKTFVARNYPSAYIRSVHREFLTPDFPRLDQVSAVFK